MSLDVRDQKLAAAAALVRRCTLSADPGLIEQLAAMEKPDAIEAVLNADAGPSEAPLVDNSDHVLSWWFGRIAERPNSLRDRMTFFWHSLIPTHRFAAGNQQFVAVQLNTIRDNALGNYRELLHALVVDGALLTYLNANTSTREKPNENFGRELMELFTIGVGNYSQADVRAASLAMTGWRVGNKGVEVAYKAAKGWTEPVTFLGETKVWDSHTIVDRLCDHPATASRVAARVWYHFTGVTLPKEAADELGAWWQTKNLNIKPLVGRAIRSEAFWSTHYSRPRSGFEYYCALARVLGLDPQELWRARDLGQLPYEPPNVGGWGESERWLGPDSVLSRSNQIQSLNISKSRADIYLSPVDVLLSACGLWAVSPQTRTALDGALSKVDELGEEGVAELRWWLVFTSPEFQMQ